MTDPLLAPALLAAFAPAHHVNPDDLPWIPSGTPGKSSKPLGFLPDNRGFVELLRMEPGLVMPLHRRTGEIHAWNITDWWKIEGDDDMVALVVVMGEVEFVHADGRVRSRATAASQFQEYMAYCHANGLRPMHHFVTGAASVPAS